MCETIAQMMAIAMTAKATPTQNLAVLFICLSMPLQRHTGVSKDSYKYPCIRDLTDIWIDEVCRITGPIYFDLLTRFPWDVHGCSAFVFILLDIIAELGIHERFFTVQGILFPEICLNQGFLSYIY